MIYANKKGFFDEKYRIVSDFKKRNFPRDVCPAQRTNGHALSKRTHTRHLLIYKIRTAPQVIASVTRRMGYVRIEAERAGSRICSEPAYNCGKRTKTTDARAKGPHAEGGQRRTKPPMSEPQTRAGNQIALQKKKEKLRAITRSRQRTTKADSIRRKWTLYMQDKIRRNERNVKKALAGCEGVRCRDVIIAWLAFQATCWDDSRIPESNSKS